MLDRDAFPWLFPYVEEPHSTRGVTLRPAVELTLVGSRDPVKVLALVDSGSEYTLAGPWLCKAIGVEPDPDTGIDLAIGGAVRRVRFAQVRLRLAALGAEERHAEWEAEVGFINQWQPPWAVVLGQRGFFDKFTVTMNRLAQAVAVEHVEEFDHRYHTGPDW